MKFSDIAAIVTILCIVFASYGEIPDRVSGNIRLFNDNGSWSGFRNQQVVVDNRNKLLIIGSSAGGIGVNGADRENNAEAVGYSIPAGNVDRFTLFKDNNDSSEYDNRNTPLFFIRPDGRYLSIYSSPAHPSSLLYRLYSGEYWAADWEDAQSFSWSEATGGSVQSVTENVQLVYLASESRLYCFIRSAAGAFHFMISSDYGTTWSYGGQLLKGSPLSEGYPGYARICTAGNSRIDLLVTDTGGIFHGYVFNGALHNASGAVLDESIFDTVEVSSSEKLTDVFPNGSLSENDAVRSAWCTDLRSYAGDTLAAIVTIRTADTEAETPDHRIVYCLFDGTDWSSFFIAHTGMKPPLASELFSDQTALDPDDRNTLYLSSTIDPENDAPLGVHELFKGSFSDNDGWQWKPITSHSLRDNLCPVVPQWNGFHKALAWIRGTCISAHRYDAAIVGIINQDGETLSKKRYIDSNRRNSFDGCCFDSLDLDYSEEDNGGDNRWHLNEVFGNEGTVIVASEKEEWEDALLIKQMVELEPGTYDFWADFWGKSDTVSDWLISTSVEGPDVELHRQMACRTVESSEYDHPPKVCSIGDSLYLYEAYAGRATLKATGFLTVFIDDHVTRPGADFGTGGDVTRTWFDGISYAKIETPAGIPHQKSVAPYTAPLLYARLTPSKSHLTVILTRSIIEPVRFALHDLNGRTVLSRTLNSASEKQLHISVNQITSGVYLFCYTSGNKSASTAIRIIR